MKKLKAFYKNNRVYSILMMISIACIVSILVGVLVYFFSQSSKDSVGRAAKEARAVKITDNMKNDIRENIKSSDIVSNIEIDIRENLIYIIVTLKEGTRAEAEAIAQGSLEVFEEKVLEKYDIQFIFENNTETEEYFPFFGYIKVGNPVIKWT